MNLNSQSGAIASYSSKTLLLVAALGVFVGCSGEALFSGMSGTAGKDSGKAPVTTTPPLAMYDVDSVPVAELSKVLFIVDNSSSMADKQSYLANGVASMVDKLVGKNVDLYLLTTTSFEVALAGADSQISIPGVANPLPYSNEVYGYLVSLRGEKSSIELVRNINYADGGNLLPWSADQVGKHSPVVKKSFQLGKSYFRQSNDGIIHIRDTMTADNFKAIKDQILSEIKVGEKGSNTEEPLCTLLRALHDQGPNQIFKSGDRAGVVILTDENDSSTKCYKGAKQTYADVAARNFSVPYDETFMVWDNLVQCDSGTNSLCPGSWIQFFPNSCATNPLCLRTGPTSVFQDCSEAQKTAYKSYFATLNTKAVLDPVGKCHVMHTWYPRQRAFVNSPAATCTSQVTIGGTPYANVRDYLVQRFPNEVFNNECISYNPTPYEYPVTTWEFFPGLSGSVDPVALNAAIISRANELFGPQGFAFAAIVNDAKVNPASCPALATQQSTSIRQLIEQTANPANVFSICGQDYSPALDSMTKFVSSEPKTVYALSDDLVALPALQVSLQKKGAADWVVIPNTQYTVKNGTLEIQKGILAIGDKLGIKAAP